MSGVTSGLALAIIGGLGQGTYGIPLKYTKKWNWENTWSMHCTWGLVVIPWAMSLAAVKDLMGVYSSASLGVLLPVFVFGILWGFGNIAFGQALDRVGLALTYGVIIGMTTAIGALIPMLMAWEGISPAVVVTLVAVLICIVGVVIVSYSGGLKERAQVKRGQSWRVGLAICIFSGIMSPMLNVGFAWGDELSRLAREAGTSQMWSTLPV